MIKYCPILFSSFSKKKLVAFFFLLITIHAVSQTEVAEDTTAKPAITGFGKDEGVKTVLKIGKDGGSISSGDGVVTLIFPEDALLKKTTISIQPVDNLAPNGNGKGYKMEPSGIIFNKPATIVFNYASEDTVNNGQALMGLAMQDETGRWYKMNKTVTDTVAKTITGRIKHFSVYVNFNKAKIFPAYARVKVNNSIRLKIVGAANDDTEGEDLIPLRIEYPLMKWSVNGIEKGNSMVGIISASANGSAIFKAPDQVPAQNPVAIGVSPILNLPADVSQHNVFFMVSNILIYDNAYKVTMVHSMYEAPSESSFMAVNYKDTGSFIVSVTGKEATVIEKENRNTNSGLDYKGECKIQQLQPGTGSLHILGVSSTRVIPPATPGGNPWVEIFFKRAPTIIPLLKFTCPPVGGKGHEYSSTTALARTFIAATLAAFPQQVRFELKEEEQTIFMIGKEGKETFIKFIAKKLKDE